MKFGSQMTDFLQYISPLSPDEIKHQNNFREISYKYENVAENTFDFKTNWGELIAQGKMNWHCQECSAYYIDQFPGLCEKNMVSVENHL